MTKSLEKKSENSDAVNLIGGLLVGNSIVPIISTAYYVINGDSIGEALKHSGKNPALAFPSAILGILGFAYGFYRCLENDRK